MAGQALPAGADLHDSLNGFGAFVKHDTAGLSETTLAVEGVRCAGCIGKIESALAAVPEVRSARLNFSTGRLRVTWDGPESLADSLARRVESLGYRVRPFDSAAQDRGQEGESRFLLLCMGIAGFASGNLMLISFALWTTTQQEMGIATRDFLHWISALVALPAIAFAGRPFFGSALAALRSGRTNMDVPISVGLILTAGMSLFETATHGAHAYFDSAVMLMFFLLVGRYLDFRARASARSAASGLLAMMAGSATVIGDGRRQAVPIRDLREGMTVLVGAGERIPADGTVLSGRSDVDLSLATGESLPQPVTEGGRVLSGTVNLSAPLTVRVEKESAESFLARIVALMEKAEQGQARYVRIADRAARLYTPVVHALALLTFLWWVIPGGAAWQDSLLTAATVLIITCPCALGLAVPVVQVLAVGQLMKRGVLVRSGDALERLAAADTVLLDKTGTLTRGRPALANAGAAAPEILKAAAALAAHSRHPLSRALAAACDETAEGLVDVHEFPGQGLSGTWRGRAVKLGSRAWCGVREEAGPGRPDCLEMWFCAEGEKPVRFFFSDPLRPDAAEAVKGLFRRGLDVRLLSGDRPEAAEAAARTLGIGIWQGGVTPAGKLEALEALKKEGRKVLMAGDGLNDAPVLAGADVSVSPSTAADIAQNAADIVFTGEKLAALTVAVDAARLSQKLVKQNFVMAVLYNIVAIPLAMAGFVTPLVAAVAMSGSSLAVILNAFRLRGRV